ncbi:MAG: hypothetical protein CMJ83_09490 [Planctomycetes bacterium]|nr:hypothetical protein [Planctomycetota bacterium]
MKRWDLLVFCGVFTVVGATAGWKAALQAVEGRARTADDAAAADDEKDLSSATLANLGVTVAKVQPTTFTRTRDIPAAIQGRAVNQQPVHAPIGGRIRDVFVEQGMVVKAGQTLMTIIRDPIPRPALTLTENVLKPGQEPLHATVVDMRKAKEEITITQMEIDRIAKFTGSGEEQGVVIPKQKEIDLRNTLLRAKTSFSAARRELLTHGFTEEHIDKMATGDAIPNLTGSNWKRALENNGLWPARAEALLKALTKKLQGLPWVIATVGELAATGLIDDDLVAWLAKEPHGCDHFIEIGSLLQRGYSVTDIRALHDLGALDPIVEVKAPGAGSVPDWDLTHVDVKAGAHVDRGTQLVMLRDSRVVYLRIEPIGGEKGDVLRVLAEKTSCPAQPLVTGAGPDLEDVAFVFAASEEAGAGARPGADTVAYATVSNTPLAVQEAPNGRAYRSWRLRPGMKYVVQIPIRRIERVLVLPRTAVTSDGPIRIVFIPDGKGFKPVEVEIAYENEDVVVVATNERTQVFPGDSIVQTGAYALGLALKGGEKQTAGHGHAH